MCVIPVVLFHKVRGVLTYIRKDLYIPDPDVEVCVILEEVLWNTLSVSVGNQNDVVSFHHMTTDLTRSSQTTILLVLHPLHFSCCQVKTEIMSPFGV